MRTGTVSIGFGVRAASESLAAHSCTGDGTGSRPVLSPRECAVERDGREGGGFRVTVAYREASGEVEGRGEQR